MRITRDTSTKSLDIEGAQKAGKYIVTWKSVYQPFYSANAGYYAQEVYRSEGNMTRAGRYFHLTGDAVNHLLGFNLLKNL